MNRKAGLFLKGVFLLGAFVLGFLAALWVFNAEFFGRPVFSPEEEVSLSPPGDYFLSEDVLLYEDRVVLNVDNARVNFYDSTGSMLPVLYEGAIGISVVPQGADEIQVGDIVSYNKNGRILVHRVIFKNGEEFIVKGDNADFEDSIFFEEIEHKLVGVLY